MVYIHGFRRLLFIFCWWHPGKVRRAASSKTVIKVKAHWGIRVIVASSYKKGETKNSKIEHIIVYMGQQAVVYHSGDKTDGGIYDCLNSSLYR